MTNLREEWAAFHRGEGEQPTRKHVSISHDEQGRKQIEVCGVRLYGVRSATLDLAASRLLPNLTVELIAHELDVDLPDTETTVVVNRLPGLRQPTLPRRCSERTSFPGNVAHGWTRCARAVHLDDSRHIFDPSLLRPSERIDWATLNTTTKPEN